MPVAPPATAPDGASAGASPHLGQQIRSGLLWSWIRQGGMRFGTLIVFYLMAKLLSPGDFGLFAAASAVVLLVEMLAEQGINQAIVQRPDLANAQVNAVFWANMLVGALLTVALIASAGVIEWAMGAPGLAPLIRVLSVVILINGSGLCHYALLRRRFDYRRLAMRTLIGTIVGGVIGIAAAVMGAGPWTLVVQTVVTAVVQAWTLWSQPEFIPTWPPHLAAARPLLGFGIFVQIKSLVDYLAQRGIDFAVCAFFGPVVMGIYSMGSRTQIIITQMFLFPIQDVLMSSMSRLAGDPEKLLASYRRTIEATVALVSPGLVLIAASAHDLVILVFGAKWTDSAVILQYLALLSAVQTLNSANFTLLQASGRPSLNLVQSLVAAVTAVIGIVCGAHWNLTGMLLCYIASQVLVVPLGFIFVRRHLAIRLWPVAVVVMPLVVAMGAGFAAAAAVPEPEAARFIPIALSLAERSAVFIAAFAVVALVFRRLALYRDLIRTLRRKK